MTFQRTTNRYHRLSRNSLSSLPRKFPSKGLIHPILIDAHLTQISAILHLDAVLCREATSSLSLRPLLLTNPVSVLSFLVIFLSFTPSLRFGLRPNIDYYQNPGSPKGGFFFSFRFPGIFFILVSKFPLLTTYSWNPCPGILFPPQFFALFPRNLALLAVLFYSTPPPFSRYAVLSSEYGSRAKYISALRFPARLFMQRP